MTTRGKELSRLDVLCEVCAVAAEKLNHELAKRDHSEVACLHEPEKSRVLKDVTNTLRRTDSAMTVPTKRGLTKRVKGNKCVADVENMVTPFKRIRPSTRMKQAKAKENDPNTSLGFHYQSTALSLPVQRDIQQTCARILARLATSN